MDSHSDAEKQEYFPIGGYHIEWVDGPLRANTSHHRGGYVPCRFVSYSRIEVRTRAEEESGEGDKGEGDDYRPTHIGSFCKTRPTYVIALRIIILPNALDDHADEDEDTEAEQHIP